MICLPIWFDKRKFWKKKILCQKFLQYHQIYQIKKKFGFKFGIIIKYFSILFLLQNKMIFSKKICLKNKRVSYSVSKKKEKKKSFLECRINVVKKIQKKDVEKKGWKRKKKLVGKMVCE